MSEGKKRRESDSIEKLGRARDTEESTRPAGTSAEITLDLVARTAIELHKLSPNEVAIHGDILAQRGQQAIELLSIFAHQLEIERRTGAAAKNAAELLSRWQAEEQEDSKRREDVERHVMQQVEWAKIPKTRPIPFDQAAKMIFPDKRERIRWLERALEILAEEGMRYRKTEVGICTNALKYKRVPEGLVAHLKAHREVIIKTYKSRIAKRSGQKGGIQRAQKFSRNQTTANRDEK